MKKYNRRILPKEATKEEVNAAIMVLERVLAYAPDVQYRLTMDLNYYRMRLQGMGAADDNNA